MKRAQINWDGLAALGGAQLAGAAAVAGASPQLPPLPPSAPGLQVSILGAVAGAALGYVVARATEVSPIVGGSLGAMAGGVLLG